MADLYVDLGISTSGATGSIGDPYGYDEFVYALNSVSSTTFKVKGYHEYTSPTSLSVSNADVTVESWEDMPARIKFSHESSAMFAGAGGTGSLFKRLVIEGKLENNTTGVFYTSGGPKTVVFDSCVFIGYGSSNMNNAVVSFQSGHTITMKSCLVSNLGSAAVANAIFVKSGPGSCNIVVNSCYFEGLFDYVFSTNNVPGTYQYHHCGFYNLTGLTAINNPAYPFSNGGNNLGDGSGASQITALSDVDVMTYPDSLYPVMGSVIIGAGDPTLDGSVDLFNVVRATDIGPVEYVEMPITCWSYTAKYRGSNRLFKMNGGGKYPSELQVPESVDISTGRMVDEGQLIDPNEFKIIQ